VFILPFDFGSSVKNAQGAGALPPSVTHAFIWMGCFVDMFGEDSAGAGLCQLWSQFVVAIFAEPECPHHEMT
jgi:hypothetical protein